MNTDDYFIHKKVCNDNNINFPRTRESSRKRYKLTSCENKRKYIIPIVLENKLRNDKLNKNYLVNKNTNTIDSDRYHNKNKHNFVTVSDQK